MSEEGRAAHSGHGGLRRQDRTQTTPEKAGGLYSLVLLAENEVGWKNLVKISSLGYLEGFLQRPRVDKDLLRKFAKGIIALSSGPQGEVATALKQGDPAWAERAVTEYVDIFGADNFFLEIQNHGLEDEARIRSLTADLAGTTGTRLVATNACHYLKREQASRPRRAPRHSNRQDHRRPDTPAIRERGVLREERRRNARALSPTFPMRWTTRSRSPSAVRSS